MILQVSANAQNSARPHGLEGVLDHVVERLLHLRAVEFQQREIVAELLLDEDVSVLNLRP
jgi:hypothetical protein